MPSWYEYEREADEIDELVSLERRRASNLKSVRKARESKKQNPLGNLKCKCKRKATAIINREPICKECIEVRKKQKEKQQNGK